MGERKVQNFYISPDFDASIIPKSKRDWNKAVEVRMMLPFSLRCNTCGEFLYAGKKFNSKKEYVQGEDYLGIKRWRFIIKCSVCAAEITFKTDPKNSDYECESGASRNFENWRERETALEGAKKEREDEDKQDAMKSLENRTLDSKLEMDVLDALDEIKAINQRHARIDTNAVIASLTGGSSQTAESSATEAIDQEKLDEELIKSVKFKNGSNSRLNRPLSDSDSDNEQTATATVSVSEALWTSIQKSKAASKSNATPTVTIVRKKRKLDTTDTKKGHNSYPAPVVVAKAPAVPEPPVNALSALLGAYPDSD